MSGEDFVKIFIVGSLNMDLVIGAPFMPQSGMTITGSGFMTNPGGKGANQAVAVAKMGGECYMVGCVGKEFGPELKTTLESYGVRTDYLRQYHDISSGIAVIVVVEGDNRIILDRGANGRVSTDLIDEAFRSAQAGDYLIVQLETEISAVEYALKKAKDKGMTTVLNPAPACALPKEIFAFCDYFIPNQTEAEFYTGIYPEGESAVKRCGEILNGMGVRNVLITLGKEGSALIGDGKYYKVEAYKADAIDTTAAGDTYVGAFVTRLSEGAEAEQAMRFASAASAVTVTRRGAQQSIPLRHEIKE